MTDKLKIIRDLVERHNFSDALLLLKQELNSDQKNPELQYLYAFCLHNYEKNYIRAFYHYDLANKYGFEEFWIHYNKGLMFAQIGDIESAIKELNIAHSLRPDNKDVSAVLRYFSNNLKIKVKKYIMKKLGLNVFFGICINLTKQNFIEKRKLITSNNKVINELTDEVNILKKIVDSTAER